MNKEWHVKHPMPPKATLQQRIERHREHARECACREAPKSLLPYLRKMPSR